MDKFRINQYKENFEMSPILVYYNIFDSQFKLGKNRTKIQKVNLTPSMLCKVF